MIDWSASPAAPLVVGGVRLEYACHGPSPSEGLTLVLLHKGLGGVPVWRDLATARAYVPGGVEVVGGCGHAPHLERAHVALA